MTKEEILNKHIDKEIMDELSENVWPDMLDAMEEYAQQQVKSVDLADFGGNEVALCQCSEDETTGCIELKCCNVCGKPQEQ